LRLPVASLAGDAAFLLPLSADPLSDTAAPRAREVFPIIAISYSAYSLVALSRALFAAALRRLPKPVYSSWQLLGCLGRVGVLFTGVDL
jgi:hypothetical protein